MSKEYNDNLVRLIGSSLYYYTHKEEINLASGTWMDYKKLTSGWVDEYRGKQRNFNEYQPLVFNSFKPMVDQLVHAIFEATEDEIERRLAEKWHDFMDKQENHHE